MLGDLVLVQVAKRLGGGVHYQRALVIDDANVIQRDDSRKLRHIAGECSHIMISACHLHRDRQFGVEIGHPLARRRPEELELQPAAKPRLVDVGQQRVHFTLVRQLLEQRAERLLDLLELLNIELEVDRLGLLFGVRNAELRFLILRAV